MDRGTSGHLEVFAQKHSKIESWMYAKLHVDVQKYGFHYDRYTLNILLLCILVWERFRTATLCSLLEVFVNALIIYLLDTFFKERLQCYSISKSSFEWKAWIEDSCVICSPRLQK